FAGDDLDDRLEPVLLVARVDPLGRIAELEAYTLLETGSRGQQRPADLAGQTGVDRRFEDDNRAWSQTRPDQGARTLERSEVGPAISVDRRRHGDDQEAGFGEGVGVVGQAEPRLP